MTNITELLNLVRLALRITTEDFDAEIEMLINDCISEMDAFGINVYDMGFSDSQIQSTVVAYCKWKFGDAENKDAFEHIYNTKIAQLMAMYKAGYAGEDYDG